MKNISQIVDKQREYFMTGATKPIAFRLDALKKLKYALVVNGKAIEDALMSDLGKQPLEGYMCETGLVLNEIGLHIKKLKSWVREKRVHSPISQFPSRCFISPEPYGVTLIMSPWNYPLQLCVSPLVGAISAGNCAVVKPSAYAPKTSAAIADIIEKTFDPKYIAVVEGGREENSALLSERFDYIFFTGSVAVGRVVMEAAAKHLTPMTLELGGKSPVIVDETADIALAAKRIAFGKTINAGQTCVEPDYLFIHESVRDAFIQGFRTAVSEFFPGGDMSNMPHIISEKHYRRVKGLLEDQTIAFGGGTDDERRFIEPTLLVDVDPDSPVMQEEIFGPILPVIAYRDISECVGYINSHPKPLALYLFTTDRSVKRRILDSCAFGGGCINDTIIHTAVDSLPFGGVGESGMGSYHGKKSFDTFTHYRSVVDKSNAIDLPMRYHPYTERKLLIVKKFLK